MDRSGTRAAPIARHAVLVMAALAICAITAALARDRTDTQAPPPVQPDQPPPAEPRHVPADNVDADRFRRHFYYATRAILVSTPNSYSEGVRYPSPF